MPIGQANLDPGASGSTTAPARPADPRRLYQRIADDIRSLIGGGEFPPFSRLPSERDLAQRLAVSRPSLREALIALEIDGSVEIRMGSGVYVAAPAGRLAATTPAMGESPLELMQARLAVEGAVVILACARMTPKTLRALAESISDMRSAIAEGRHPVEHDRTFHLTISRQAGNTVLDRIVEALFDERHGRIAAEISSRYDDRRSWSAALAEHEAIHAALEAADPLAAQGAMSRHMQLSAARWTEA